MFKRRAGVDTVDFTRTKTGKKIAPPKEIAPSVGGFLDFTQQQTNNSQTNTTQTENSNPFGFLSDFSQNTQTQQNQTPQTSFFDNPIQSSISNSSSDVNALKIKIEDLEYKLERLLERLSEMETKFGRA